MDELIEQKAVSEEIEETIGCELAGDIHTTKYGECEGLVRMFLRFRFCGIVCCVLYRFPFPQSDL